MDIQILDLRSFTHAADFFFVCSSKSERQSRAIADHIQEILKTLGHQVHHHEGYPSSSWILLDYGDMIFHIFHGDTRSHYDLEGLWCDANRLPLPKVQRQTSQEWFRAVPS